MHHVSQIILMVTLLSLLIISSGCDCSSESDCDECEKIIAADDDDIAADDDDNDVSDDDDVAPECATTASHEAGPYYFPIRVTLSNSCNAEISYMRQRADGSGDIISLTEQSPVYDIFIDRDTKLVFHAEGVDAEGNDFVEDEQTIDYDFPPKFRGIISAYAGDEQFTLQWEPAWDEDLPLAYRIYQPIGDAPIPTLFEIGSTIFEQALVTDAMLPDVANGTVECFVVRAVDAKGMEDLNYVTYCLNPQPVFYVDGAAAPGGDGSMNSPFDTIQGANNAMTPLARYFTNIYVAGGTYQENLDFSNNDPPITNHIRAAQIVGGFDSSDWERDLWNQPTVVDGGGGETTWIPGELDLIDGFYMTGADVGLRFTNTLSVTIKNCFIHGNERQGILIEANDVVSGPSLTSTVLYDNTVGLMVTATGDVDSEAGASTLIRNLIVLGNHDTGIKGEALGGTAFDTILNLRIRNLVITENEHGLQVNLAGTGIDSTIEIFNNFIGDNDEDVACNGCASDTFFIEFSNIIEPDGYTGYGMISELPGFIDPPLDFNLRESSLMLDAGSPDPLFDDPDRTRNDIGAYGGIGGSWTPLPFPN